MAFDWLGKWSCKKEVPANASSEGYDSATATADTPTLTRRTGETSTSSTSTILQNQDKGNEKTNASNEPMRKELIEQAAVNEDTWVVFPASAGWYPKRLYVNEVCSKEEIKISDSLLTQAAADKQEFPRGIVLYASNLIWLYRNSQWKCKFQAFPA